MKSKNMNEYELFDLDKTNLAIIASRPSMGKTAFAIKMVENCLNLEKKVTYFTLDSRASILMERLESSENLIVIDPRNIDGAYNEKILEYLQSENVQESECIFIDYIQLIGNGGENQKSIIDNFLFEAKRAAITKNLKIILLSQLSRKVEERYGHRPQLSDLAITSAFEEIADLIILLLRREYYDPMDKPGMMEAIIAKSKNFLDCYEINYSFVREDGKVYDCMPFAHNLEDFCPPEYLD